MVKHSTLIFAFITALGLAFITFFLMVYYWGATWSAEYLTIKALIPNIIFVNLVLFLIVGTGFLTFGILGIGRQRIKNKRKLFTVLTVALTPLLVFTLFFSMILATTYLPASLPPEKMAITQVSVTANNPLTLSLNAKSFYSFEIWFDEAYVKDYNQTTVASIIGKMVEVQNSTDNPKNWPGYPYWTFQFVARLPAASEKILTLNFNTTLPSGEYSVWLHSYRQGTFTTLYFSIP
jgi:hypothetical protein